MKRLLAMLAALLAAGAGYSQKGERQAQPYVRITAPADGATIDAMEPAKLVYEVGPGAKGHHVHVFVDGREVGILRRLRGSYTLETLSPGARTVCIKVVSPSHVPIGVEQCIKLDVR
jgi:hypothetical protein